MAELAILDHFMQLVALGLVMVDLAHTMAVTMALLEEVVVTMVGAKVVEILEPLLAVVDLGT